MTPRTERSYRALLQVPGLGRILLSMQLSRIAQAMVGVALVLFTLNEYHSPALTGAVTFASVLPGLLVAPVAGVLLDRHGRTRLVILDYCVALLALVAIGGLALAHALSVPVLFAITIVSSLTAILSQTGLRSLFPLIVPERLWERVNAIDSNGYLVATILGPPIAAGLVSVVGGPTTLILIGLFFGTAAVAMIGAPDPDTRTGTSGSLLLDAWHGIQYTWRNPTLRGLGFSISLLNLSGGMVTIVVPLIILDRLHAGEVAVGLVFAASGVAGMIAALIAGRLDSRGKEWSLLVLPMGGIAVTDLFLLGSNHAADAATGLLLIGFGLALGGALNGPMDIGLFTIRQRRTDPAWMGRAFAVSMAFNFIGYPIGAALAGAIAAVSIDAAIIVGASACVVAGLLAAVMIPRREAPFAAPVVARAGADGGAGADAAAGADPSAR
ncbi:MAG TPA: MFS transporter [Candidatus Limnocylindrales bacterium]|nr:MFS transporter [Candidatus Limnocylindrales bacterium]